jgi:glycosyltransferase 2 family protein
MIGAHHSENRARGWLFISMRWLAGITVLGILLHFLPLDLLREAVGRIPRKSFVAILLGYLLAHCVGIVKWRIVVNAAGAQLDFATSVQCYAGGLFGTLFLPSIVGGDVVRLAVGLRRSPKPAAVLAGNIADRFLDVMAQVGLVLLGVCLLPGSVPKELQARSWKVLSMAAIVAAVVVLAALVMYRQLLRGRSVRFRRRLARLRHAVRSVAKRPHVLVVGWLLGTGIQTTFLVLTVRLAVFCGLQLPLRVWFFAWPLAKLAAVLPLTQGGIGIREAALVGLLSPFGAAAHLVLAAGLVWEGVIILGGILAGVVAMVLNRAARNGDGD